jgi:regulator of protease activity HflC (stomatin/prohibitin superfamily)
VNRQSALIKAESERDVTVRKGEGEAIVLRRVEEIKSNLREVLIRQLTDPILGSSGAVIRDPFIAIRYIEAVEKLSLAIVRDDLTALRYVEALEKIAEGGGNKTVVVGESQRLLT